MTRSGSRQSVTRTQAATKARAQRGTRERSKKAKDHRVDSRLEPLVACLANLLIADLLRKPE